MSMVRFNWKVLRADDVDTLASVEAMMLPPRAL